MQNELLQKISGRFLTNKNIEEVLGKYKEFEEKFYLKVGQIKIPSGLSEYYSKNRAECKEKIRMKWIK